MNQVTIDLEALGHNIDAVNRLVEAQGASWTLVTKVLCGHEDTLRGLFDLGVRSIADSRIANLEDARRVSDEFETWYLRLPHRSAIPDITRLSNVTLNSEIATIEALDAEARRQGKRHGIIIMIELGDLREGVLPGALVAFYQRVFELENIEVLGIGANLGCLSGATPNIDQLMQLVLYRELLELKFEHSLPFVSAGTSATIPLLLSGECPKQINHFRIGEAVFLGTDLVNDTILPGFRDDIITVEAEVVEAREKSLTPFGDLSTSTPFEIQQPEEDLAPGQRGHRVICTIGQLDTEVGGLTPIDPNHTIAGATSDLTVVNVAEGVEPPRVGEVIRFRASYGALLRLMTNRYMDKVVLNAARAAADLPDDGETDQVPPVLEDLEGIDLTAGA